MHPNSIEIHQIYSLFFGLFDLVINSEFYFLFFNQPKKNQKKKSVRIEFDRNGS